MAIDFRCPQCNHLLRTEDNTAGKQAQCPRCGAVSVVPLAAASAGASAPSGPPATGDPFAQAAGGGLPPHAANPYQSPHGSQYAILPGEADPLAARRVSAPATALMVMAILGALGNLVIAAMYGVILGMAMAGHVNKVANGQNPQQLVLGSVMIEIMAVGGLIANVVLFLGARKMYKLQSYPFAMIAAVLALIPALSPCCVLGVPFGIWAMVVLCNSSVKAAFRS
jgi:hypothetical protein